METGEVRASEPPPRGACDCHAHVYGPPERYPLRPGGRYTPPAMYLAEYQRMLARLGIDHAVIVQPTVYQDNAATADALAASAGAWRGVAKFTAGGPPTGLPRLDRAGFRGVRVHGIGKEAELDGIEDIARQIAPFGWHIQLHMEARFLQEMESRLRALPVPVVLDHFARVQPEQGPASAAMHALLRLLAGGRCWVKLSGPYLVSKLRSPYPDLVPIAKALVTARPDHMLWGTDWPHPSHETPLPDDTAFLALLATWVPDRATREMILVSNPAALYGFEIVPQ
ncbi:MAG: amidohydrolase family protein [Rhodospirillales bacterium]|nr:amidohydrolase family protein [Rhodospirillales bacterium]